MRKFILTINLLLAFTIISFAQAPQGINYQSVIRNSSGAILVSQPVGIRFDIHQGATTGPVVYSESQIGRAHV